MAMLQDSTIQPIPGSAVLPSAAASWRHSAQRALWLAITQVSRRSKTTAASGGPVFQEAIDNIVHQARATGSDEIVLAVDHLNIEVIEATTERLQVFPLPLSLIPEGSACALPQKPLRQFGTAKVAELRQVPLTPAQCAAKRVVDLIIGTLVVLFILPVMICIAVLIRLDSPGPILFRQRRMGLKGQLFHIYKFRTMTTLDDGAVIRQARRGDDRVTCVGAVLRRFSLDELPQLFNVLKGEMSLVGPRPHALAHDIEYQPGNHFLRCAP